MLMTALHFVSCVCVLLPTLCVRSHYALCAVRLTNLLRAPGVTVFSSSRSVGVPTSARRAQTRQTNSVTELAECVLIDSVPMELHVITRSREQEEEVCRLTRSGASSVNARLVSSGRNPLTGRRTVERRQEADPMRQNTARRA